MPITINGSAGTITGVSVGGLPDGCIDADTLAASAKSPITVANTWRLANQYTYMFEGTNAVINSNWEEADSDSYAKIGTSLSESSGVFTFPETGMYLILSHFTIEIGNADDYGANVLNEVTVDGGSNWTAANITRTAGSLDGEHSTSSGHMFFDVTNTSTHLMRFQTDSFANNTRFRVNTNQNYCYFTAIRIGDT